jgi:L-cystine transport system substrate-binding protein
MKKKMIGVITILAALLISACGTQETSNSSSNASNEDKKVQKIIVGTGTQFPNVCFIDEDGKLTGYDVELVRKIDEKLPE